VKFTKKIIIPLLVIWHFDFQPTEVCYVCPTCLWKFTCLLLC